ncbi:hypothetical protein Y695_03934 [Hydrogenophaga sp. T4]|nr:hypothetical protein Y695_03934 [Hydrogenophaga sp. T4]
MRWRGTARRSRATGSPAAAPLPTQRAFSRSGGSVDADHGDGLGRGLTNLEQGLEVVREGLGHALRVFDAHRQAGRVERRQREAHGDAVVVVGMYGTGCPAAGRRDADEVSPFLHQRAELAAFGCHGSDAVGLLHAPARDVAQRGGAIGEKRHHGQGHGRIGDVVAVEIDSLEGPGAAADVQAVGFAGDVCTHEAGGFDEADVSLDGGQTHAFDGDAIAAGCWRCQCTQGDEITGRRCIAFNRNAPG